MVDNFEYYQIGVVCASKKYTKSWRTSDVRVIKNETSSWYRQDYIFDIQQLVKLIFKVLLKKIITTLMLETL